MSSRFAVLLLSTAFGACAVAPADPELPALGTAKQAILEGRNEAGHRETALLLRATPDMENIEEACTAVFISPRLALTAAHCVSHLKDTPGTLCDATSAGPPDAITSTLPTKQLLVYTDEIVLTPSGFPGKEDHAIAKITVPPSALEGALCGNDVAMVELEEPLDATITPARVALRELAVGEAVTAVGYGANGRVDEGGRRRSRSNVMVTGTGLTMTAEGLTKSTATEWLADTGPCAGDSGSPAFDEAGELVGIMSRGSPRDCVGMVYGRVDATGGFGAWIREVVVEASGRTGDALPAWAKTDEALPPEPSATENDAPAAGTSRQEAGCRAAPRSSSAPAASSGLATLAALMLLARRVRRTRRVSSL